MRQDGVDAVMGRGPDTALGEKTDRHAETLLSRAAAFSDSSAADQSPAAPPSPIQLSAQASLGSTKTPRVNSTPGPVWGLWSSASCCSPTTPYLITLSRSHMDLIQLLSVLHPPYRLGLVTRSPGPPCS